MSFPYSKQQRRSCLQLQAYAAEVKDQIMHGTSGNAAYRGAVEYNHTADRLAFRTAGTGNRLIIDSSGRLLSGTTTEGHADADDLTLQAPSGYTGITLRSGTTTGGAIYFSDATSGTGELDGQIVYSQNSRTMTFATAAVTNTPAPKSSPKTSSGLSCPMPAIEENISGAPLPKASIVTPAIFWDNLHRVEIFTI